MLLQFSSYRLSNRLSKIDNAILGCENAVSYAA